MELDLHQHVTFATLAFEARPLLFRRIHPSCEIENDMAFLFRKVMGLGRHGLKELLLVAGNIFRKFYVLCCFSTSSWQIFRS